jgi:hypothetical protein
LIAILKRRFLKFRGGALRLAGRQLSPSSGICGGSLPERPHLDALRPARGLPHITPLGERAVIDYLTYYYSVGAEPFRCLSALPDDDAIRIMEALADDTPYGARFKDPAAYMRNRRMTERWVREQFIAKGGRPREHYPVPMVLGSSRWMRAQSPNPAAHGEIRIPLSVFTQVDVSFTYPDSMISLWFGRDKPQPYYLPDYHGIVFTMSEILSIVEAKGLPEDEWDTHLPDDLAPYIEAQVWNQEPLQAYKKLAEWGPTRPRCDACTVAGARQGARRHPPANMARSHPGEVW